MNTLQGQDLDSYLLGQDGHIIHQIWFDSGILPKKEAKKTMAGLIKYRDSWLIKNPTWGYKCWGIDDCRDFMKTHFPEHLEMYDSYYYQIQRCDCIRYFILFKYGGLYADMDYCCLKSWDEVLKQYPGDLYLTETPNKIGDGIHISNSLMYSRPGHPYWKSVFIEMQKNMTVPVYYGKHMTVMYTTGPCIINRLFDRYKHSYKLNYYPYKKFHPFGISDNTTESQKGDIYAYHVGKGSWESNDSKCWLFLYTEMYIILFVILIRIIILCFV